MQIKTYQARTMREALDQVRQELGPGASVLHTRAARRGWITRLLRGDAVEVAATADPTPGSRAPSTTIESTPSNGEPNPRIAEGLDQLGRVVAELGQTPPRSPALPPVAPAENRSAENSARYAALIEEDFEPAVAREIVSRSASEEESDRESPVDRLAAQVGAFLPVGGPIDLSGPGRRVVALVGPTGVGKTTTLAKLAANFRLHDGVRVGLVTVDTFRVAAVEQLRTYAELIGLPMEVVASPDEMREAMRRLSGLDLVLIDTAGRSPRDGASLEGLRTVLAEAAPDEVHLVLGANMSSRGLHEAIDRFRAVGPTSLLWTKLDEAPALGQLAGATRASRLAIGYTTDGQGVPEDIRVADQAGLASLCLGGVA